MLDWNAFHTAFGGVTLRHHGAFPEQEGCVHHNLDTKFPEYEEFWRRHIVPCTNRPTDITWRDGLTLEMERMGRLSYGIWIDVLEASKLLVSVQSGDLGANYRNCLNLMKSGGDALQKFSELQEAVEGPKPGKRHPTGYWLAKSLGTKIGVFPAHTWPSQMKPWREENVGYRNFLTHEGSPPVLLVGSADKKLHLVLKKEFVVRGSEVNWINLAFKYDADPSQWESFNEVCRDLHEDTLKWLNRAYEYLNAALRPLLTNPNYRSLWGWNQTKGPGIQPSDILIPVQTHFGSGVTSVQDLSPLIRLK